MADPAGPSGGPPPSGPPRRQGREQFVEGDPFAEARQAIARPPASADRPRRAIAKPALTELPGGTENAAGPRSAARAAGSRLRRPAARIGLLSVGPPARRAHQPGHPTSRTGRRAG